jgi:putative ABC transport system permease protein
VCAIPYYSLKCYHLGAQWVIEDGAGHPVTLQIVGMLAGSMLQGDLLIGESHFRRLYPEISGARFFLVDLKRGPNNKTSPNKTSPATDRPAPDQQALDQQAIVSYLETGLEDYGFDMVGSRKRLASFMTVQNTYLSTFQSLGGLGLLLGTVGLALVQIRAILERRGELALLRSVGMAGGRLVRLVLIENFLLLLGGLAIGTVSALVAVLPHWLAQQAETPWTTLGGLLMLILLVGLTTSWLAAKATLRVPLLPALQGD